MTYQEYQKQRRIKRSEAIISRILDTMATKYAKVDLREIDSVYNRGHSSKLNTSKCAIKARNKKPRGNVYVAIASGASEVRSVNKVEKVVTRQVLYDRAQFERGEEFLRRYGKRRKSNG